MFKAEGSNLCSIEGGTRDSVPQPEQDAASSLFS
jgi:hypothetical protein